jgi:hypothetical protein
MVLPCLLALLVSPLILAESPERTLIEREGFFGGFSTGLGLVNSGVDSDDIAGLSLQLHLGRMISPDAALVLDLSGVVTSYDALRWPVVATWGIQYWFSDALWMRFGVGVAHGEFVPERDTSGLAFLGAIGREMYRGQSYSVDLQIRANVIVDEGAFISSGNILLGLNWF